MRRIRTFVRCSQSCALYKLNKIFEELKDDTLLLFIREIYIYASITTIITSTNIVLEFNNPYTFIETYCHLEKQFYYLEKYETHATTRTRN